VSRAATLRTLLALSVALVVARTGPVAAPETEAPAEERPRESKLVETTETRLAQIDVTVTGPKDAVADLGRGDFEVSVGWKELTDFYVDVSCLEGIEPTVAAAPRSEQESKHLTVVQAKGHGATYLFYFDQANLTQGGRQVSIDLARELVPKLVTGGSRAMIVSNAPTLTTIAPLTSDASVLLEALGKLKSDDKQWDPYPTLEDGRLAEIQDAIGDDLERAVLLARRYEAEERFRQEKSLRRLSNVLGTFSQYDAPKAVLYFADILRSNAGEHYMSFFGQTVKDNEAAAASAAAALDAGTGVLPLDRVINEASANGIRFYTVEGQGMMAPSVATQARSSGRTFKNSGTPGGNSVRFRDAEGALSTLAVETGGKMFLSGVGAGKIADRVLKDVSCLYLISFDPAGYPKDTPLPVKVTIRKPHVQAQTRGRIVLQSDSARLTSRLLAAFASPEATRGDVPLRIGIVPTGFKNGVFSALVQVGVAGTVLTDSTWDLGASLVSGGQVRDDGSGRVQVKAPRTPVVFEKEMTFHPGPYQIVGVAHETTSNLLASKETEGVWPDLKSSLAMLGPLAFLQPANGAFLRAEKAHTSGTLVVGERDPILEDAPLAIVGIVCRSADQKGVLHVLRRVVGEGEASFPPLDLELGEDRCALFRDLVAPKTLGPGEFRFEVRVLDHDKEVAKVERPFVVVRPGA
jgi:VWFA-related protein